MPQNGVWIRVQSGLRPQLRRAALVIAERLHVEPDDAEQELALEVWQRIERGLTSQQAIEYATQRLLSRRSPLRSQQTEDCPPIQRGRRGVRSAFRSPLTPSALRLLSRLTSSTMDGILSRVEREAPLRCPACGGRGWWGDASDTPPDGPRAGRCIENEAEARERWPLYDSARKARDSQVWWCSRCGGWTWDPVARATEATDWDGQPVVRPHLSSFPTDSTEEALLDYVHAATRRLGCVTADAIDGHLDDAADSPPVPSGRVRGWRNQHHGNSRSP